MRPFDYTAASAVPDVLDRLTPAVRPLAGGTDLLPLMKVGLQEPELLIDLKRTELDRGIEETPDGWRLGALTTLSDIEHHAGLRHAHPALGEAVSQAATPQLRNRATIAGNLLQRPRCWYFRHEDVGCWLSGGSDCPARTGRNEHHAIVDRSPCVAVHPSDAASVLVALDATVEVRSGTGDRSLRVEELLAPPTDQRRVEHVLEPGDLITALRLPASGAARRSVYLKAMDRAVWAFALAGIAAVVDLEGGAVRSARLVASGVANVPWRLTPAEEALQGGPLDTARIDAAVARCTEGVTPLARNGYKVRLVEGLTRRALQRLAGPGA